VYSLPDQVTASDGTVLNGRDEIIDYYESFADFLIDQGILDPNNITQTDIQRYFTHIYTNKNSPGSTRQRLEAMADWKFRPRMSAQAGVAVDYFQYAGLAVVDGGAGLGASYEIPVDGSRRPDVYDSTKLGAFVQYRGELMPNDLWLTAGARYDHQNHYGGSFNPRLSAIWGPGDSHLAKLTYSEAYREPNVFELAGDPGASPAKLRAIEAQYTVLARDMRVQVTGYRQSVSDFLGSVGSLIGTGVGVVDSQSVWGVESSAYYRSKRWLAFLNGAHVIDSSQTVEQSDGSKTERDVLGMPRLKAALGVAHVFDDKYSLAFLYRFANRYNALSGNASITESFEIPRAHYLSAVLSVRGLELGGLNTEAFLTVQNALDRDNFQANIRRSGPHQFLQDGRSVLLRVVFGY
jgi:outer membrane receptor protein involved in Fe transport